MSAKSVLIIMTNQQAKEIGIAASRRIEQWVEDRAYLNRWSSLGDPDLVLRHYPEAVKRGIDERDHDEASFERPGQQ